MLFNSFRSFESGKKKKVKFFSESVLFALTFAGFVFSSLSSLSPLFRFPRWPRAW